MFIGHAPSGRFGLLDWGASRRQAKALFQELDVQFDVRAPVRGLSMADQQLIEIAKALSVEARVLILDEPTASLSAHEVERLFSIVRRLRDRGVSVLFVSHRLDEVFELCDRATVFRDGRHVVTTATRDLTTADLVRHMVGRSVSLFPKVETAVGDVLLEVEGLTRVGEFRDITFEVRAGEIVGFAGLVGAGRTEVARVLFGIDERDAGVVRLGGKAVSFASPSAAMDAGIAYLPEDRHQQGLVLDFSIAENVTLPILPRLFPQLLIDAGKEREVANEYTARFDVRMTGVDQPVGALSGGNQQKVVLAKWLASKPGVLILDEPDPRHRHRRQGRRPPDDLRPGRVGPRDHPHLERPPRDPRDVRPHPRPPRGPHHRRDRAPGRDRGAGDGRRDRQPGRHRPGAGGRDRARGDRWLTPWPPPSRPAARPAAGSPPWRGSASSASSRSWSSSGPWSPSPRRSS